MTIALTLFMFMIISLGTVVYFIAIPMAQRSADDFAAVIVSGAQNFQKLPQPERAELEHQLLVNHGLIATLQTPVLPEKTFDKPYYLFFQAALARRTGQEVAVIESANGPLLWVDIPVGDSAVRMGFERHRITANPPVVLILVFAGGILLTLITSLSLVKRIVGPLSRMSFAVRQVGHGRKPPPLSEDGPEELATLARAFNRMSSEVQELSENRTVMVAGISHDLRTPLTRLGLAVELLSQKAEPKLIAGIRRDLAAMDGLIGQFLQFSKGLGEEHPEILDLYRILVAKVADLRREGAEVQLCSSGPVPYRADRIALERVLANLLENAAHYGGGAPVDVDLQHDAQGALITISDRGPGIAADQVEAVFRPFHRLEAARSNRTGGSGLGLAIARQLANKYGWTIELLPREGGGTVAKLILPIIQGS